MLFIQSGLLSVENDLIIRVDKSSAFCVCWYSFNSCYSALDLFKSVIQYTKQANDLIIRMGKSSTLGPIQAANGLLQYPCNSYNKIPDNEKKAFGIRLQHRFNVDYEIYQKLCELGGIEVLLIDENDY